jgi:hypothetical protein
MFSVKTMMRSTVAVGGALVLLAAGASAANATTFTPTGAVGAKASTTNPIKLRIGGGSAPKEQRTCLPAATAGTGSVANVSGQAYITALNLPAGSLTCTDGLGATYQTTITLSGQTAVNNVGGLYWATVVPHLNISDVGPYGTGLVAQSSWLVFPALFTNGTTGFTGANPSTLTITDRAVGHVIDTKYGPGTSVPIRVLSGSFNVGPAAAPLTISG